jgi:hypothetical protein
MPNFIAYAAMLIWPLVALRLAKKLPLDQAVVALFLIPFLLLPEKTALDFPGLPPFDKRTIPALIAFAIFYFGNKERRNVQHPNHFKLLPESKLTKLFVICLFIFPILTAQTNKYPLQFGPVFIPGLGVGDIVGMYFQNFTELYVPFILGYNFLRTPATHETIARWMVVAGLIYTIPMLWEIRMSPQLHTQIYGFFPHMFDQQFRQGGFRPVVFLGHGLEVAMFIVMVAIAAACLWQAKLAPMNKWGWQKLVYIGVVIVLCKTMGAIIFVVLAIPLLFFFSEKMRIKILCCMAIFVFCFPILRGAQLIPVEQAYEFFKGIEKDRADSLKFRFDNEDQLLARAEEKKFFGWGGWGRNAVYDRETGKSLSVTDGYWIIIIGAYGWLGYLTVFGLLCFPMVAFYRRTRRDKGSETPEMTLCLSAMLAFNLLDLLPNASFTPITVLLAGAIQGWASLKPTKTPEVKAV